MKRPDSLFRLGFSTVAAAVVMAVLPAAPAAAATQTTTSALLSGISFSPGSTTDNFTSVSVDGGAFTTSTIVSPLSGWGAQAGTQWISTDTDPAVAAATTAVFRRQFTLPPGLLSGSLTLCVLAEDAVEARLNGTVIGSLAAGAGNAADPETCFAPVTTGLVPGHNLLEFTVQSSASAIGLNYRAVYGYTEELDVAPLLVLPDDMTVPAQSADGASVFYTFDVIPPGGSAVPSASCSPPSGQFPVGATTVNCSATGQNGLTSNDSFTVTVLPFVNTNAPPVLSLPADITLNASSTSGRTVGYQATATDDSGIPPAISCLPPSGSLFPVGATTVTCTATDDEQLTSEGSFTVTVIGPLQRACSLLEASLGITLKSKLVTKLSAAAYALHQAGRDGDATTIHHLAQRVKNSAYAYIRPALRHAVRDTVTRVMARACCSPALPEA